MTYAPPPLHFPGLEGYTVEVRDIPRGDPGHAVTLQTMRDLARRAAPTPPLRELARYARSPESFRRWLAEHWWYEPDPPGIELVRDPALLAAELEATGYASGDCDDLACFTSAIALAAGRPARYVVVAFGPWSWEHVWCEMRDRGRWWELDVTRPIEMGPDELVVRSAALEV